MTGAGMQRRGYVIRVKKTGAMSGPNATKKLNLNAFVTVPGNSSMPKLIALYLKGQSVAPPATTAIQQPVPSKRATLGIRLCAWLLDVIVIAILVFVLGVLFDAAVVGANGSEATNAAATASLLAALGVTVPIYLVVGWHVGSTVGMRIFSLRVVDATSGLRLSWKQSLLRLAASLPSIILLVPLGLFVALPPDRLAFHDRIARTVVVSSAPRHAPSPASGLPS